MDINKDKLFLPVVGNPCSVRLYCRFINITVKNHFLVWILFECLLNFIKAIVNTNN